jgi:cytochrome c-type biogenesis protein CcmH
MSPNASTALRRARARYALALSLAGAVAFGPGHAMAEAPNPATVHWAQTERFRQLTAELRCLVCQNQSVLDSHADLAVDLRHEVERQMAQGRSDAQIKAHLVARYGEFVLYRPQWSGRTLALWLLPAVMVGLGLWVLRRMTRRRATVAPPPASTEAAQRLAALLETAPPNQTPARSAKH